MRNNNGIKVKRNKQLKVILFIVLFFFINFVGLLYVNQVDNDLSEEDKYFIARIMHDHQIKPLSANTTYEKQIEFIKSVQQAVLATAPKNGGLPEGTLREPKQLYENRVGLCYDRSRVIEKILRFNNFNTRHIAAYSLARVKSPVEALLSTDVESHALSEVETINGWVFVDSNELFIGLRSDNKPVSMDKLQEDGFKNINWHTYNNLNYRVIYKNDFTYLYGLYSRHGKFYPPFNFIPDVNWGEFVQNL